MDINSQNPPPEFIGQLMLELSSKELVFPTSLIATMKIRHALGEPDISNDQIARIIGAEPVLSAQVLRVCNSAIFSRGTERVSELRTATLRLGFMVVRNLAIAVGMKQLAERKSSGKISERMEGLWTRSLRIAALSYVITRKLTKLSPDSAMLAGLLHEVGRFYILNRAYHCEGQFATEQALWEIVDQWHAPFGAAILKKWHIAHDIRDAIAEAGSAGLSLSGQPRMTDVLTAASFLDAHFIAKAMDAVNWDTPPPALQNLQLDLEKSSLLMSEGKDEFELILQAIG